MSKGLMVRELAAILEVTEDTVINWELRGIRPRRKSIENLRKVIGRFQKL